MGSSKLHSDGLASFGNSADFLASYHIPNLDMLIWELHRLMDSGSDDLVAVVRSHPFVVPIDEHQRLATCHDFFLLNYAAAFADCLAACDLRWFCITWKQLRHAGLQKRLVRYSDLNSCLQYS